MQALESGDEYAKTIGLSEEFKKLNRFANITNCECIPPGVNMPYLIVFIASD